MKKTIHPRGLLLVAALITATLAAHLATRGSDASPVGPTGVPPAGGGGAPGAPAVYSAADGLVSMRGRLDRHAVLQGGDRQVRMELVLAAGRPVGARAVRTPTDLVVILDRSGSMDGDKIVKARAAVRQLLGQLAGGDRFALVTYADGAELTIPLAPPTPAARRGWLAGLESIDAAGGTAMSHGLDLAIELAGSSRRPGAAGRMILISDGLANQGDPTPEGLTRRAARAARSEIVVSTVGVGLDFNEFLLSRMADAGTGNYYYLRDAEQLAEVFAGEFEAGRETVASALEVEIDPAPGVTVVDVAGYPLERSPGGAVTFRPGSLFAEQERRVWVTFDVADDTLGERPLGAFRANYARGGRTRSLAFDDRPKIACVRDEERFFDAVDRELWASGVVEEDYGRLRMELAREVKEQDLEGARSMISTYRQKNEVLNSRLDSAEVRENLEKKLTELEAEVEDAFQGADQLGKQNRLSKAKQLQALDARRPGSKKAPQKQEVP